MSMENQNTNVKSIILVALFAAVTFLGIQIFRIPMPAVIGTPFIHFGHIFVVMGVLLMGGKRGAVSGTLGLVIFDLLNGYIQAMPQVFLETIVKCLLIGALMEHFRRKSGGDKKKEYAGVIVCSLAYALMNIVIEFIMGTMNLMIMGSGLSAALTGSLSSIPATVINAVFMVIAVILLYKPVRSIYIKMAGL